MKKTLCVLLSALLLLTPLASCDKPNEPNSPTDTENTAEQESKYTPENNSDDDEAETTQNGKYDDEETEVTQSSGNDNEDTETQPNQNDNDDVVELPEVYREYPNLKEIGTFNKGLAPFIIQNSSGEKYGYINIQGEVVIEPLYSTWHDGYIRRCEMSAIPSFSTNNYISVLEYIDISSVSRDKLYTIYDINGNIIFSCGTNNVTQISPVSNGYFAVETQAEEFTGYVYTVTYYSARDLREIVSIKNSRIFDQFAGYNSRPDENGHASLSSGSVDLSEHDPLFTPVENTWQIDIEAIESFQGVNCYYNISSTDNDMGQIAAVILINRDNICYYATVDSAGNVLMPPQKNIAFAFSTLHDSPLNIPNHSFCKNLCPAQDTATGLWGYIDPYGSWAIEPQYSYASDFSSDGYATVDSDTIIDTEGNIVLSSPQKLSLKDLYGTYTRTSSGVMGQSNNTLTINPYGNLTIQYSGRTKNGQYVFQGKQLIISDLGTILSKPFNTNNVAQDGSYSIQKTPTGLIINGLEWTRVE